MRALTLTLVVATLGVGGVALAQPELVVDPWGSANAEVDSWFGQVNERPDVPAADPVLVDPWQPVREPERVARAKRVEVFPIAPVTSSPPDGVSPKTASPLPLAPVVIDPWAPGVVSEIPSLEQPGSRVTEHLSPWSGRMIEIVDPWGRVPNLGVKDHFRLIVDPWAR